MKNETTNPNTNDGTEAISFLIVRMGQVGRYRVIEDGAKMATNEVIMLDVSTREKADSYARRMNDSRTEGRKNW